MSAQTTGLWAMQTNPKFIFFTDFDGTITLQDSELNPSLSNKTYYILQAKNWVPSKMVES